jgi:hypothetical protein
MFLKGYERRALLELMDLSRQPSSAILMRRCAPRAEGRFVAAY